jgi:hypothetical protein
VKKITRFEARIVRGHATEIRLTRGRGHSTLTVKLADDGGVPSVEFNGLPPEIVDALAGWVERRGLPCDRIGA